MKQKTFEYWDDFNHRVDNLAVGQTVILIEKTFTGPHNNGESWFDCVPYKGEGIPGNMNPGAKRYHGWRGTTDDISKEAHGVRKIIKLSAPYVNEEGARCVKVTVGPDLHPDWL